MLGEGDRLPNATLLDAEGQPFSLSNLKGKPAIIYFYPKADTPGCTSEAQDFTTLIDDFATAGLPVVAISRDPPKKLAKFRDKYGLKVKLASDEDGSVCEAFGTWIEKSLYGRKYMGIARATFLVDADGRIVRAWPAVKVKGHAAEVLEKAQSL